MGSPQRGSGVTGDDSRERRRQRTIALAAAFALLALALLATLSHASQRRIGTNDVPVTGQLAAAPEHATICQAQERIPSGTAAVRVALTGGGGPAPQVRAIISSGGVVQAAGGAGARWDAHETLLVPLASPLRADVTGTICVALAPAPGAAERYKLGGWEYTLLPHATIDGRATPGRLHLEYLAAGTRSWWSFASTVARRIERGHAWSGASVALLLALLMIAPIALGAWQLARDPER